MPGVMIERPKMTRLMYQSLKRHIMREREKIKQEQEQDEALERLKKERELKKKKEEEDSLTLEETKETIMSLGKQLETLREEKHELFSNLKKVLHQEDESRRKAQLRENSELLAQQQQAAAAAAAAAAAGQQAYHPNASSSGSIPVPTHPGHPASMYMQGAHPGMPSAAQSKYMNVSMHRPGGHSGVKRARSPSPPQQPSAPASQSYSHYPPRKYPAVSYPSSLKQSYPTPKSVNYPTATNHVTYASQSQHIYQSISYADASSSSAGSKYAAASSRDSGGVSSVGAFSTYPGGHYHHHQSAGSIPSSQSAPAPPTQSQKPADHYAAGAYTVQQQQQQQQRHAQAVGYLSAGGGDRGSAGSSLPLQQQLEHANQKSGFGEDKFKMQQPLRGMAPIQGQMLSSQSQSQPTGGIVSGYPVRTQQSSVSYPSSTQNAPASTTTAARHGYPGRFYMP